MAKHLVNEMKVNRPKNGFAFVWMDGTTASFYASADLEWDPQTLVTPATLELSSSLLSPDILFDYILEVATLTLTAEICAPTICPIPKVNRPKNGFVFVWMDDTTFTFHKSADLEWYVPASVTVEPAILELSSTLLSPDVLFDFVVSPETLEIAADLLVPVIGIDIYDVLSLLSTINPDVELESGIVRKVELKSEVEYEIELESIITPETELDSSIARKVELESTIELGS